MPVLADGAVEAVVQPERERQGARPARLRGGQPVVAAEEDEGELVAVLELVVGARLVVPVDRVDGGDAAGGGGGGGLDHRAEPEVQVAAPRRHRELRAAAGGPLEEADRLVHPQRDRAVEALGVALAGADVDRAGQVAAVGGAVAARIEVDAVEQLLVDHRGEAEEVEEDRDAVAVEVDAGVRRRRAAHEQRPADERRAGEAGQVLHRADRVVHRAGHVDQLVVGQRAAGRRVLRLLARHRRLQLADRRAVQRRCAAPRRPRPPPPSPARRACRSRARRR